MTRDTKPVAKSLHTLTVLQQVASINQRYCGINDPAEAMALAMVDLGLAGRPDPYGLQARALELMTKGAKA